LGRDRRSGTVCLDASTSSCSEERCLGREAEEEDALELQDYSEVTHTGSGGQKFPWRFTCLGLVQKLYRGLYYSLSDQVTATSFAGHKDVVRTNHSTRCCQYSTNLPNYPCFFSLEPNLLYAPRNTPFAGTCSSFSPSTLSRLYIKSVRIVYFTP